MELTGGYNLFIAPYQQPVLIYNPAAGKLRRNPKRIIQRTTDALRGANLFSVDAPRLLPTSGPGDATALAREAVADGADLILVLGGDGTINEAVNGMAHSDVPLAIVPAGTANVLAMEIGLGSRLERAISRLSDCVTQRVSLGRVRESNGISRYFLAMGGVGLDAKIVCDLDSGFKARAGKLAYWATGLAHVTQPVGQFEARVNGSRYRCGFALASRVRNYGGDLEIATGASLAKDDFEIILFEGAHPLRYLMYLLGVATRRVQEMPGVRTFHAGRVDFTGDVPLQIDGEFAGRLPASFEIVRGALTLLLPRTYK